MEEDPGKKESCLQILGGVSPERRHPLNVAGVLGAAEEKKLELRLGPPGDWSVRENASISTRRETDRPLLSLGCSAAVAPAPRISELARLQSIPTKQALTEESSQENSSKAEQKKDENKKWTLASASAASDTAIAASSQTRSPHVPVVGWPPIRSFRKSIACSSPKPALESPHGASKEAEMSESSKKGMFVKINMEGVPIGRKIDLKAFSCYQKLSVAVDELFRGLFAAQEGCPAGCNENKMDKRPTLAGPLNGSGEYTLVYEDNEGDRLLVGDVPWDMFITTVKRLWVLKSSEVSTLRSGGCGQQKSKNP